MKEQDWKELLNLAIQILQHAGVKGDDWVLGGGTALMYYFHHRKSKDIDIFLSDAQLLPSLSPRLNDIAENIADDYSEQSNFIKIIVGNQQIDFIIAPNITGLEPNLVNIEGKDMYIEKPEEIIAKKLYYRPESLKIRDIIDISEVYKHNKDIVDIVKAKRIIDEKIISSRVDYLIKHISLEEISSLSLERKLDFSESLSLFIEFLEKVFNGNVTYQPDEIL